MPEFDSNQEYLGHYHDNHYHDNGKKESKKKQRIGQGLNPELHAARMHVHPMPPWVAIIEVVI